MSDAIDYRTLIARIGRAALNCAYAISVGIALFAPSLHAQTVSEGEVMHWGYASFFDSGWYTIADGGEDYSMRVRPGWT